MGNKSLIFLMLFLFSISFISAYEPHQQDTNYTYAETVANAEQCNLTTITYPDGTTSTLGITMDQDSFDFSANISSGNFSQLGETCWAIICYDSDATPSYVSDVKCLEVTTSGEVKTITDALANILLLLFFLSLIFGVYALNKNINFESWHNSIMNKYENKNYVKLVLSSITYNLMKNNFVIYYLLGFPIILIITSLVYSFNLGSMVTLMGALLSVYTYASLLVGLVLFSHVQEWLVNLLNNIRDMSWGIE